MRVIAGSLPSLTVVILLIIIIVIILFVFYPMV